MRCCCRFSALGSPAAACMRKNEGADPEAQKTLESPRGGWWQSVGYIPQWQQFAFVSFCKMLREVQTGIHQHNNAITIIASPLGERREKQGFQGGGGGLLQAGSSSVCGIIKNCLDGFGSVRFGWVWFCGFDLNVVEVNKKACFFCRKR